MTEVAVAFVIALVLGFIVQPVLLRVCERTGHLDAPDGRRKRQSGPVALSGGLGVAFHRFESACHVIA